MPPLPTPPPGAVDPAALGNVASVRLYCERARSALPAFELVAENSDAVARICRALDGLPLAIELAAARVRVLGPEGTAKRLGETLALLTRSSPDIPERQRSLRATIDWSYDLLDADAQQVFRVLGAFAGGGSLDGVESICPGRRRRADRPRDAPGCRPGQFHCHGRGGTALRHARDDPRIRAREARDGGRGRRRPRPASRLLPPARGRRPRSARPRPRAGTSEKSPRSTATTSAQHSTMLPRPATPTRCWRSRRG